MDYSTMTARELRKLAPSLGLHGASRMTKSEILAALAAGVEPAAPAQPTTIPAALRKVVDGRVVFDREAAAALRRTPTTVYDPAAGVGITRDRSGLPRRDRRHRMNRVRLLDGGVTDVHQIIPRASRRAGWSRW